MNFLRPRTLEGWLRLWLLAYSASIFVVFAGLLPWIALQIEDELFRLQLEHAVERLEESGEQPRTPFVHYDQDRELPADLFSVFRDLEPGIYELDDFDRAGIREGFVAVRGAARGQERSYLVLDVSGIEILDSLRHPFFVALVAAGGFLALLGTLAGLFVIRRVVCNLDRLATFPEEGGRF